MAFILPCSNMASFYHLLLLNKRKITLNELKKKKKQLMSQETSTHSVFEWKRQKAIKTAWSYWGSCEASRELSRIRCSWSRQQSQDKLQHTSPCIRFAIWLVIKQRKPETESHPKRAQRPLSATRELKEAKNITQDEWMMINYTNNVIYKTQFRYHR